MCISTCPTGAITENAMFKPGPVKTESFKTICNYCSVGCELLVHHKSGFVMKVTGSNGLVNSDSNICRLPKFGYNYLNNRARLTTPLLKVKGRFEEITFDKANQVIASKIKSVEPGENAFYAGARLTNEELFLVQKLAREYVRTNNLSSFHYAGRGDGYFFNSSANLPFEELNNVNKIYLIGSEINYENPVVGYMINNTRFLHNASLKVITDNEHNRMIGKADSVLKVKSYYHFIKAVNYYLLKNNLQNALFIKDNVNDLKGFSSIVLFADYEILLKNAGVTAEQVFSFANEFNEEVKSVIVFSEKHLSSNTSKEIFNLALITGKLGKTSCGIISLKEKNNSQGLIDMGISPELRIGGILHVKSGNNVPDSEIKNLFIFGEDPVGCAVNKEEILELINKSSFKVVSDYFITETAELADLILPASLPFESGGTFTNTQKYILSFQTEMQPKLEKNNCEQLIGLISALGNKIKYKSGQDVTAALASELQKIEIKVPRKKYNFSITDDDDNNRKYEYGCDYIIKSFEEDFLKAFENI
jgi:predicted molibdopterin-dependent oxidoreductase YjgC